MAVATVFKLPSISKCLASVHEKFDLVTRLAPAVTGLPMHISISMAEPYVLPNLKVASSYSKKLPRLENMFSVTIPASAERHLIDGHQGEINDHDLRCVFNFIELNREMLVKYWYQLEGCEDYMDHVKSI